MDAAVGASLDLDTAVVAYRGRVYRYLIGMARDPDVAEDLTQEVMLRALRTVATLRDPAALPSWLYRLATNVFLDKVRADRRRPQAFDGAGCDPMDEIPASGPGVERAVERAEMSACVRDYVNQLPDGFRAVVLLHDEYGLTDQQVADTLGLSVAAAKMRIHRGRARLRAALEAGCQVKPDDRGVIVCDPVPDRRECGPGCTWCSPTDGAGAVADR